MDGTCVEKLPSLNIPCSPALPHTIRGQLLSRNSDALRSGSVSLVTTPETPSIRLPKVPKYKRINGYQHKTMAYGSPEVVKKIFTGQLTSTYFNDICYGKRATPTEFRYSTPVRDRQYDLWEPKSVSREKTRHDIVRDIQDARLRKQTQLEKTSQKKAKESRRRTEATLMRGAAVMPRGVVAYLEQMDRQKLKYDARVAQAKQRLKKRVG